MDTGTKISAVGHAGLILWAMVGGLFNAPAPPPAPAATDVSLISGTEFAALQPPGAAPSVSKVAPVRPALSAPEKAPAPKPKEDARPAIQKPAPEVVARPDAKPDAVPKPLPPQKIAKPQVAPAPESSPPPASESAALVPGTSSRPRAADRVAPTPAPEPAPEAKVSDRVRQSVTPDAAAKADVPKKPQEAEAPKAATTQIITEATKTGEDAPAPQGPKAPDASPRPRSRPALPVEVAAKPEPAEQKAEAAVKPDKPADVAKPAKPAEKPAAPPRDAIADALADALSDVAAPAAPSDAPAGPPMTGAEKNGLRRAISGCWNLGSSSTDAMRTTVVVGVTMKPDGSAEGVRLISSDGPSDTASNTAFDAARRAILRCVANADLPPEKYESWRDIELVFNPDGMRLR